MRDMEKPSDLESNQFQKRTKLPLNYITELVLIPYNKKSKPSTIQEDIPSENQVPGAQNIKASFDCPTAFLMYFNKMSPLAE